MTSSLDIEQPEALVEYLKISGRISAEEQPMIRVLSGGVSNRTVWLERENGEAWVLKQALAKLRVKVDWFSSPERVLREALGLKWLAEIAPGGTITPLIFVDESHYLLAMQAVPQPHENWKTLLLKGELSLEHVEQFGRLLGLIHKCAFERREEIEPIFADRAFFETLRIEPYYSYTASQVPETHGFYQALIDDTRGNLLTLVHGDYSPKNVLVYQDHLILLDHEVIHWGDPAFDLGFSTTHLLSKAHHVSEKRSVFAEAAKLYWRTYRETLSEITWAQRLEARAVRHTLACLLARVDGRSPLEYLTDSERERQRKVVVSLVNNLPETMPDLIERFVSAL
jgi:5-methylthioribose kinase